MNKYVLILLILFFMICPPVSAQENQQYLQAKYNFDTKCVRGLAQPVLLKTKVQKHHFQIKYTTDDFPLLYGLETAEFANKQSIRLKNVGCESYAFDIELLINAQNIEKNHQLCQSCLIQELKRFALYFQKEDGLFYLEGIQALEQHVAKYKTFKVSEQYQLKGSEEMPQTFSFKNISKQKNGQYLISLLNSVGLL